mgnify:CR=1 FL=1
MLFCITNFVPTTVRDSVGLIADTFVDPFAHATIREKQILGASGNSLDYYSVKGAGAVDFRAANDKNFENLEKNSIDFYASVKSLYLQDRQQKILNTNKIVETQDDSDWEEIETQ